jgi:hypothetical protein
VIEYVLIGAAAYLLVKAGKKAMPIEGDKPNKGGLVEADPIKLAEARGVSLDVYALARMMASEASDKATRVAVGWAARNYSSRKGKSISSVLLAGTGGSEGSFGAQNLGGKYASTKNPPTDETISIAGEILTGKIPDPTGGCTLWDAPVAQDAAVRKKVPGYRKTSTEIAAERSKGFDEVWLPGITTTRFWRPRAPKAGDRSLRQS